MHDDGNVGAVRKSLVVPSSSGLAFTSTNELSQSESHGRNSGGICSQAMLSSEFKFLPILFRARHPSGVFPAVRLKASEFVLTYSRLQDVCFPARLLSEVSSDRPAIAE